MPDLTSPARGPPVRLAGDDHGPGDPRADREEQEVGLGATGAEHALGQPPGAYVVAQADRHLQRGEVGGGHVLPADVGRVDGRVGGDQPRDGQADAGRGTLAGLGEVVDEGADRLDHAQGALVTRRRTLVGQQHLA